MFEVGRDVSKQGLNGTDSNSVGRSRMKIVYVIFLGLFILFSGRTLQLAIHGTNRVRLSGSADSWLVHRADIIDRNGDILAKNVMSGHITLRPHQVKDKQAVAEKIHEILPYEYSVNQALKLLDSSRRFIYVKKYVSDSQRKAVETAKLAGLEIEANQARKYPKRRLFSHVVGFVGNDGHGLEGAERIYDDYLRDFL